MAKAPTGQGARGEDREIPVPAGTEAEVVDGSRIDLVESGQRAVIAHGGRGGHGNKRFANSTRQAPRFSENGTGGEEGWIELRLKLLADAGLIGLPNAGKSSLLSRLTRATPKVAEYPFTTISPILGTIEDEDRQAVLADIPGLIEGAAGGAGLGHEFLAHVERCAMLIHLVDVAPLEGDPVGNYEMVRAELSTYGAGLDALPELIVLSKRDLLPEDEVAAAIAEWGERLGGERLASWPPPPPPERGWTSCATSFSPSCPRRFPPDRGAARATALSSRPSTASTVRPARAATGSSARTTVASAFSVVASSSSSSATTSATRRRSPISSSG